jgi:hypothetical protein
VRIYCTARRCTPSLYSLLSQILTREEKKNTMNTIRNGNCNRDGRKDLGYWKWFFIFITIGIALSLTIPFPISFAVYILVFF